ncbi:MAG TPA: SRPBCC family protein [Chloroflexota bacterium]|nr:SRPBCC family protein [Chloroflexota bacterium]
MPANDYDFLTTWRVEGTLEEVADILQDVGSLTRWWPAVYLEVEELHPGDERGLGREVMLHTKGWLPYTLRWGFRIVEVSYPMGFALEPWGDFTGRGEWTLRQQGPWVVVTYRWQVRANKPLLRWLTPVLRPIFEANHRWAMATGETSLRLELVRRRTSDPQDRALIPPPPGPTSAAGPLLLGAAGGGAAVAGAWWLARRVPQQRAAVLLAAGFGAAYLATRVIVAPAPRGRFVLDPHRVAAFEAAGWRAYYDRNWPRLLWLIVRLSQEQFRIPFPVSLLAAYHVTRAAMAWAPLDHDERRVREHYAAFYRLARRYSGLAFDPAQVAELELRYNDVHRRLVGQADKSEFLATMAALHRATFGLTPEAARESAAWRVLANNTVDRITGGTSTDVEGDWLQIEDYLRRCYRTIRDATR